MERSLFFEVEREQSYVSSHHTRSTFSKSSATSVDTIRPQGDEVNASRENSLTGSGAKQTQTMHPVVNVASRASITTIACDRTNYFVSTGCIIPSGIRVYTNNVSESVLVSFFSGQEWMTLSGDRFR